MSVVPPGARQHIISAKFNPRQTEAAGILSDRNKKYVMFYGGSRSGKTWLSIRYIRARCLKYPGSKHLVARYSFANAKKTIWLQTMLPEFRADEDAGLCRIQKNEGIVEYTNGSIVLLGGLEPSRIDSVLAAEYGTIFVTEANENSFDQIEMLFSRLNDTALAVGAGEPIPLKFIVDLNPTVDRHWTNVLFRQGIDPISREAKANYSEYAYLKFVPEDNAANLAAGYIESLKNLSPARRKRFYEGDFGSYEGLVFQIDDKTHIVDDFEIPAHWPRARSIDFGYVHPFVCLWSAMDPVNEVVYFYREHVEKRMTVHQHTEFIKRYSIEDLPAEQRKDMEAWKLAERLYQFTVTDHDAEDRATLEANGIFSRPANKDVLAGLDNVIDLLTSGHERSTKVKIFRGCTSLIDGLYSYRWRESDHIIKDREVVKEDDDEADAFRYALMEWFPSGSGVQVSVTQSRQPKVLSGEKILEKRLKRLGLKLR